MTTDLAIYDMDRTVTRRATYTPFLLHCAMRRAPWRLLLLPLKLEPPLPQLARIPKIHKTLFFQTICQARVRISPKLKFILTPLSGL